MGCVGNQAQENCKLENEPLLQRLCDLYVSFRRRYVLCLPSGAIFTPQRKNKQGYALLTNGVLRKHLLREYSVAIFAGGWGSKFVCFDVDDASAETVKKLLDCLEAFGFPRERIYVSFSGGKGYHVEIFFNQLVATEYLKRLYRWVIARGKFDPHKVEFRPTNTMAIKLPLSIHARTGKVCWYVDRETLAAIERVEYLMEIETLSASVLDELIAQNISGNEVPEETDETKSARIGHGGKATDESRNLGTKLTEAGTRHNMMRNIAIHKRYLGATSAQCRKELLDWYEQQDKDIAHSTREEVQEDIDELISWVYSDRFE